MKTQQQIFEHSAWEYFPGSVLVVGSAAKAAAISLRRILDDDEDGRGVVFRHTLRDGTNRLRSVLDLEPGRRPIGWTRELTWPAPSSYGSTVRAISRNRLRVIALRGQRVDEPVFVTLGKDNLWRAHT